jgi:hypothetical protein
VHRQTWSGGVPFPCTAASEPKVMPVNPLAAYA